MTATEVIAEIDRLPPAEQQAVILHVHELEEAMIPESFLQGMREAERGELMEIKDNHYTHPPL